MAISLGEVVDHFSNTSPPKRELALGINDGPNKKKKEEEVVVEEENKFETKKKGKKVPFRRVVTETVEVNPTLTDNSANASFDTWGARVSKQNQMSCS